MDSIEVTIEKYSFEYKIIWPDAFTPKTDQLNDNFKQIRNEKDTKIIAFRIHNRWGEIVHNDIHPWDGYYNGILQNEDVHTFYIQYSCIDESAEKTHLGPLNLIR